MHRSFNIRVYGVCIKTGKVLVSKERYKELIFTKFPGGGLEFGEGTMDCLRREMREEFSLEIKNVHHFYTTDYFQASAFNKNDQLISIYYLFDAEVSNIVTDTVKFTNQGEKEQYLQWVKLDDLSEEMMRFPVDKIVVKKLLSDYFS